MNHHYLNEMTELNNELVNTQRILVKKNAEISRLNKQLQLTNADLVQFTYVVSHDLKEPLRMVTSFMELLRKKHAHVLDEKGQTYINYAIDGGKRMRKMIDNLLELSQIGRDSSPKEIADLNVMVKEVKENLRKLIEESGAKIVIKSKLPVLPVYRSDILRLLQNLLSNAIKFRKKELAPMIYLNAVEDTDVWLFCIEDNGIGIQKEETETIFEIFARLHSNESYEGSGLGLAICKKVVQHHGGTIWVESEEGIGSRFYFKLTKNG